MSSWRIFFAEAWSDMTVVGELYRGRKVVTCSLRLEGSDTSAAGRQDQRSRNQNDHEPWELISISTKNLKFIRIHACKQSEDSYTSVKMAIGREQRPVEDVGVVEYLAGLPRRARRLRVAAAGRVAEGPAER